MWGARCYLKLLLRTLKCGNDREMLRRCNVINLIGGREDQAGMDGNEVLLSAEGGGCKPNPAISPPLHQHTPCATRSDSVSNFPPIHTKDWP